MTGIQENLAILEGLCVSLETLLDSNANAEAFELWLQIYESQSQFLVDMPYASLEEVTLLKESFINLVALQKSVLTRCIHEQELIQSTLTSIELGKKNCLTYLST